MILLRTGARALIWQSPESSARGVLSDGVLETGTERTVYTMVPVGGAANLPPAA